MTEFQQVLKLPSPLAKLDSLAANSKCTKKCGRRCGPSLNFFDGDLLAIELEGVPGP